jgi:flagellar biosynthesis protein FlhB
MKNYSLKPEDNVVVLTIGTGMFLWLTISSFLYTLLTIITRNLLLIFGISPRVAYCLHELLYAVLFILITWRIINYIRKKEPDNSTVKKIFKASIIALACCQVLQFLISYYIMPHVFDHYVTELLNYERATRTSAGLKMVSVGLNILKYIGIALLIFKRRQPAP